MSGAQHGALCSVLVRIEGQIDALQTKIFSHCGEMECTVIAFFEGKLGVSPNLIHEVLTKKTLCTTV